MTNFDFVDKLYLLGLASITNYLFGNISGLMIFLCIAMIFDYITGILKSFSKKEISSKIGLKGIFKKISILIIISVVHLLEINLLTTGTNCRDTIIIFYIGNECISIIENIIEIGVPVPNWLKKFFKEIRKKGE